MNYFSRLHRAVTLLAVPALCAATMSAAPQTVAEAISDGFIFDDTNAVEADSIRARMRQVRSVEQIMADLPPIDDGRLVKPNPLFGPRVFSGYRHMPADRHFTPDPLDYTFYDRVRHDVDEEMAYSELDNPLTPEQVLAFTPREVPDVTPLPSIMTGNVIPPWLRASLQADRIQQDFLYNMMLDDSSLIDYAYWDLPEPPRLPEEDVSFDGYLRRLDLPEVDSAKAQLMEWNVQKTHWLHVFNTGLQFSQAYMSDNWYQGGNNNISLLFNFLWDVMLNPVWHQNFLLQSTFSYKLGLNSTPQDTHHDYNVSQDLLQYNFKMGLKATHNWYYSLTAQFKTQLLKNYEANSDVLKADFLSSGDLTVGLGMTFSKQNKKKTVNFAASLSPLSYNLKSCISDKVDHAKFGIPQDRKFVNEIGSSAELTFNAALARNISYNSRLFLFSDYSYFLGDWENTLSFQFNRFLSTQIYAHLRFDSSSEITGSRWKHWMLKEILSFGLTYSFSTK